MMLLMLRWLILRNIFFSIVFDSWFDFSDGTAIEKLLFVLCSCYSQGMVISFEFLASSGKGLFQFDSLLELALSLRRVVFYITSLNIFLIPKILQFFDEILILILQRKQFCFLFIAFFAFLFQSGVEC